MDMSDDGEIRIQLARMEGKQDVTNERLNNVQTDIVDIRRVQHAHSAEIQMLKTSDAQRGARAEGLTMGGKIAWGAVSVLAGGGLGAVILKIVGG